MDGQVQAVSVVGNAVVDQVEARQHGEGLRVHQARRVDRLIQDGLEDLLLMLELLVGFAHRVVDLFLEEKLS